MSTATGGPSSLFDHDRCRFNEDGQDMNLEDTRYDLDFYANNYFEYEQGNSEPIVKGRLRASVDFWKDIGASQSVLQIIQTGYKLPLINTPPTRRFKNNNSALSHSAFVSDAISDLLSKRLIVECLVCPHVVNPLSVSEQSSGKLRLILDLRFINQFLWKDTIKFEDWNEAIDYFQKGDYLFAFDLKSGYHHIEILPHHTTFLGFSWDLGTGSKFFKFQVLPFGLSTAPYVFTKCLRPLVKHWRSKGLFIVLYLDDGWGRAPNIEIAAQAAQSVKADILAAGLVPNIDKSQWEPIQVLDWLGMTWDSKTGAIYISQRRILNVLDCISNFQFSLPRTSARRLASLAGKIISLAPVVGRIAQLKTRFMHYEIISRDSWDKIYSLACNSRVIEEVFFWKTELVKLNKRLMVDYTIPQVVIYTDASQTGCGAWVTNGDLKMQRNWSGMERKKSSTFRELKAVEITLKAFAPKLHNKTVQIFTDNKAVVSIVSKGSMVPELHNLSLDIFLFCRNSNLSLQVQWVPREHNVQADAISRIVDFDDWGVSPEFFHFIDGLWGPHSFDRFADDLNTKLPRFNSKFWCPHTTGVDAFSSNWFGENNWLVPPIYLVPKLLRHLKVCAASGTLIVPDWPSAPFWTLLFSNSSSFHNLITHVIRFTNPTGIFIQGRNTESVFGTDKFCSHVLGIRLNGFIQ